MDQLRAIIHIPWFHADVEAELSASDAASSLDDDSAIEEDTFHRSSNDEDSQSSPTVVDVKPSGLCTMPPIRAQRAVSL